MSLISIACFVNISIFLLTFHQSYDFQSIKSIKLRTLLLWHKYKTAVTWRVVVLANPEVAILDTTSV